MLYNVRINTTCADPGIFVRVRGGGGGVQVNLTKKALTTFFFLFFFCPQLILQKYNNNLSNLSSIKKTAFTDFKEEFVNRIREKEKRK